MYVIIESEPHSELFSRVRLSDEQFKEISDLLAKFFATGIEHDGIEEIEFEIHDEFYKLEEVDNE